MICIGHKMTLKLVQSCDRIQQNLSGDWIPRHLIRDDGELVGVFIGSHLSFQDIDVVL